MVFVVSFSVCFAVAIVGLALFNIMVDTEDSIRESDRSERNSLENGSFLEAHWMEEQELEAVDHQDHQDLLSG